MSGGMIPPSEALQTGFVLPAVDWSMQKYQDTSIYRHGVRVGSLGLLLPTEEIIAEVFDELPLCELPNTPKWLYGMANRRGNILPVFDLHLLFGLTMPQQAPRRRILVCGEKDAAIGMLIDAIPEKIVLKPEDKLKGTLPRPEALRPFVTQIYRRGEQIWVDWKILDFFQTVSENIT